jgi:hypothetical protein
MGSGINGLPHAPGPAPTAAAPQGARERGGVLREMPVQARAVEEDRTGGLGRSISRKFSEIKNSVNNAFESTKDAARTVGGAARDGFLDKTENAFAILDFGVRETERKAIATVNGTVFNATVAPKYIRKEIELNLDPRNLFHRMDSLLRGERPSWEGKHADFKD